MKIEKLNKIEKTKITRFQRAWIKSVKDSFKKRGLNKKARTDISKDSKIIGKSMVLSGLKLGMKWLESRKPRN